MEVHPVLRACPVHMELMAVKVALTEGEEVQPVLCSVMLTVLLVKGLNLIEDLLRHGHRVSIDVDGIERLQNSGVQSPQKKMPLDLLLSMLDTALNVAHWFLQKFMKFAFAVP